MPASSPPVTIMQLHDLWRSKGQGDHLRAVYGIDDFGGRRIGDMPVSIIDGASSSASESRGLFFPVYRGASIAIALAAAFCATAAFTAGDFERRWA